MPSYNPEFVIATWGPIIFQGVMDGEFFNAEHQEDDVMLHVGSQGYATFVENANKSGIITVTLSQRSPTNALLSIAMRARRQAVFTMKERDNVTVIATGVDARIQKHAPIKRGKDIVGMEWKFLVPKLELEAIGDIL